MSVRDVSCIKENIGKIREDIKKAAAKAGRRADDIVLMAVTKTFPIAMVNEAIKAGIATIGENRVQEAAAKFPELTGSVEKHFIGHLQVNKVNKAIKLFDWIESLDNVKLANKLNQAADKAGCYVNVLVEVKLEDEVTKHGIHPGELKDFLTEVSALERLRVQGLMAIPPFKENQEEARPYFKELRGIFEAASIWKIPGIEMRYLSMGMSHDFRVAIEEGANIVRIGSAIFGGRG